MVKQVFLAYLSQQEVDYIEEKEGHLYAFEFKWNVRKPGRITKAFTNAYPEAKATIITPENFRQFIIGE